MERIRLVGLPGESPSMLLAEEQAFLRQIRQQPDHDAPRLIYADWLDERNDPLGEFIRIQCALAQMPDGHPALQERERTILEAKESHWAAPISQLATGWQFRRGFIERISVDAGIFARFGGQLLRAAPITRTRFLNARRSFGQLTASKYLGWLREIDLFGCDLRDDGVALLSRARYPRRTKMIDLSLNGLTDRGLAALAGTSYLNGLRSLRLADNLQLTVAGLGMLGRSEQLQALIELDISGCGLEADVIDYLEAPNIFPQLESLIVTVHRFSEVSQ